MDSESDGETNSSSDELDLFEYEVSHLDNERTENIRSTNSVQYQNVTPETYNISSTSTDEAAMTVVKRNTSVIRDRLRAKFKVTPDDLDKIQPYELFEKCFLEGRVIELLQDICNARLMQLSKPFCTETEVRQAVRVVMAAAFYKCSVTKLLAEENKDVYHAPIVNNKRIMLVIRCMEGKQPEIHGSSNSSVYGDSIDIERMEEAFTSIYCPLVYTPEMVLSADDGLTRQRSKRVTSSTTLKQINIPGKGMGCVQTTVACPLTNITLSSRYSLKGESYTKSLQILIRRVQMRSDDHMVDYGFLSAIFLDRGYISDEVVLMLQKAKLHLVGTQKRGRGAPFGFGPESEGNSKGHISDKGITTEFWASRKWCHGYSTHHLAFREERITGAKIAALLTTRRDLASGEWGFQPKRAGTKVGKNYHELDKESHSMSDVATLTGDVGDQVLNEIESNFQVVTESQSTGDKLWFMARSLHFTSTVSLDFLKLLGKECNEVIGENESRRQLYEIIGINLECAEEERGPSLCTYEKEEIETKTVAWLKSECRKRKIKGTSQLNRTRLIDVLSEWAPSAIETLTIEEQFAQLAFKSWCMKPRRATEAMKTGCNNEHMIRKTVGKFLEENVNWHSISGREYGLLKKKSRTNTSIATSPDMIGAINAPLPSNENRSLNDVNSTHAVAYEFKTFTGMESLQTASSIASKYGRHININIGGDEGNTGFISLNTEDVIRSDNENLRDNISLFKNVIPWIQYRYQILHHSATLNIPVIFVAASKHSIIYTAHINFAYDLLTELIHTLDDISHKYLNWTLHEPIIVPKFRDTVFGDRTDHSSIQKYFNLVLSFQKKVQSHGPFPAAQYIRPKLISMWNTHKGGTDVMPQILKNASFEMSSINPQAYIIWRFVQMGAVNTYYITRMLQTPPSNFDSYQKWLRKADHNLAYSNVLKSIFQELKDESVRPTLLDTTQDLIDRNCRNERNNRVVFSIAKTNFRPNSKSPLAKKFHKCRLDRIKSHHVLHHSSGKNLKHGSVS